MTNDRSSQINWIEWGDSAFEEAEKQDKLILLDLGASWCHWCHVMDRTTYSNPEVIKLINEKFIPVRVDADKRPDIQDRYLMGGWPTTAFLLPDGRILTGTTFIPPEAMINKADEVDSLFHDQRDIVKMHVSSMAAEAEFDRAQAEIPEGALSPVTFDDLKKVLKEDFDSINGGFGGEPKFPFPDGERFAFLQYRRTDDKEMLNIALKTLDGMMGIYDPVWGGFYRYSIRADWSEPHYEKLLYVQATAMDNYLEAYQVTGDDKYGEVAAGIKSYIHRFLSDLDNGGFYGSQDADVNSHNPDAELVMGDRYFIRDEAERLEIGTPYTDKTIYTDWNGMMISAYLRLYHVMGDQHARDFALKTIDRILAESMQSDKLYHYIGSPIDLPIMVSDHVYFGQALVDAYQTCGARKYLSLAEKLVSFMVAHLQDVVDGGFYFQTFDPHAKGEPLERHKPFDENVAAAILLNKLHYLTGYKSYRNLAERTLGSLHYPQVTQNIVGMGYGLALDLYLNHPVHIVLVGDRNKKETKEMLETSLHAYEPSKLVQVLDPEEAPLSIGDMTYEADEETIAYVCVQNICRPPAKSPNDLAVVLEDVIGGTPS